MPAAAQGQLGSVRGINSISDGLIERLSLTRYYNGAWEKAHLEMIFGSRSDPMDVVAMCKSIARRRRRPDTCATSVACRSISSNTAPPTAAQGSTSEGHRPTPIF
jgi:hypothetical protein